MDADAPYRELDETSPVTLTDDERRQMASAGRRMRMGAVVGGASAFGAMAGAVAVLDPDPAWLAALAVIAVIVLVWLRGILAAGAALAGLGDRGPDYRGLALALTSLRDAFAARALASLTAVAVLFAMFVVLVCTAFSRF